MLGATCSAFVRLLPEQKRWRWNSVLLGKDLKLHFTFKLGHASQQRKNNELLEQILPQRNLYMISIERIDDALIIGAGENYWLSFYRVL